MSVPEVSDSLGGGKWFEDRGYDHKFVERDDESGCFGELDDPFGSFGGVDDRFFDVD